ncbi:HNH endonuclease [Lacrimispora xylanisolvens]|uniref:HNH endonuclease n=1 Tax=Lacrimispora xylanisolvens TaxID=384636 RepID=UPI002402878B
MDALRIHGYQCFVCGFDFKNSYGELGKEYIEIHHKKPLYSLTEEIEINPETDLIPVCSNCHRMIHRRKDRIITVEELKEIVQIQKLPTTNI